MACCRTYGTPPGRDGYEKCRQILTKGRIDASEAEGARPRRVRICARRSNEGSPRIRAKFSRRVGVYSRGSKERRRQHRGSRRLGVFTGGSVKGQYDWREFRSVDRPAKSESPAHCGGVFFCAGSRPARYSRLRNRRTPFSVSSVCSRGSGRLTLSALDRHAGWAYPSSGLSTLSRVQLVRAPRSNF